MTYTSYLIFCLAVVTAIKPMVKPLVRKQPQDESRVALLGQLAEIEKELRQLDADDDESSAQDDSYTTGIDDIDNYKDNLRNDDDKHDKREQAPCSTSGVWYAPIGSRTLAASGDACRQRCVSEGAAYFNKFPDGGCHCGTTSATEEVHSGNPTEVSGPVSCSASRCGATNHSVRHWAATIDWDEGLNDADANGDKCKQKCEEESTCRVWSWQQQSPTGGICRRYKTNVGGRTPNEDDKQHGDWSGGNCETPPPTPAPTSPPTQPPVCHMVSVGEAWSYDHRYQPISYKAKYDYSWRHTLDQMKSECRQNPKCTAVYEDTGGGQYGLYWLANENAGAGTSAYATAIARKSCT